MSGFFSRNASTRQIVAVGLVLGVTQGIASRGSWTEDYGLMRLGAYAIGAVGLALYALLAAIPARWIPGMWQEDGASFLERSRGIVAWLGGMLLSVAVLWFSPWPSIATATALLTATALAVAFLFVTARKLPA